MDSQVNSEASLGSSGGVSIAGLPDHKKRFAFSPKLNSPTLAQSMPRLIGNITLLNVSDGKAGWSEKKRKRLQRQHSLDSLFVHSWDFGNQLADFEVNGIHVDEFFHKRHRVPLSTAKASSKLPEEVEFDSTLKKLESKQYFVLFVLFPASSGRRFSIFAINT